MVVNIKNMIWAVKPCSVAVGMNILEDCSASVCRYKMKAALFLENVGAPVLNCMPSFTEDHTLVCMNIHLSNDVDQEYAIK